MSGIAVRWHRTVTFHLVSAVALLCSVFLFVSTESYAQTAVVGASSSNKSTVEGARRSFFDTGSSTHWVFWYNGSAVEYASSGDASSWTSRGTLPYNTPNFSVAFKRLAGTSYIFVVAEANTYDVVMRRGVVQATSISFDGEDTVLDGSAVGDRYLLPSVSLDANGKVWTSAFKDLGDRGDRYHLAFRRTQGNVEQSISFDSISLVGKPAARVSRVAMVPTSADKMLAVVSGESGANVISYTFDGASWSFTGAGGEYGRIRFAEGDLNDQVNAQG